MSIVLGFLLKKWKYVAAIVAALAACLFVVGWYHEQLGKAYEKGVADQKAVIERQEYQIKQKTEEIDDLQVKLVNGQLETLNQAKEVITKDVDHYITVNETKFVAGTCHPDAEYLSLWDRANQSPGS